MTRIERILCPVDFSPVSKRALEHAAVLAQWYESRIVALHVTPLMPTILGFPPAVDMASSEPVSSEAVLRELTSFVDEAVAAPTAEKVLRSGHPPTEIVKYAGECGADLIVLGTHGRGGFEHLVLGSTTEKVLRKAHCPVLTVPAHDESRPGRPVFERILCGADFSDASNHAVQSALSLAQEANGRLTLLHVMDWMPKTEYDSYPQFDGAAYRRFVSAEARRRLEALVPEEARNWCEPDLRLTCGKPYREILKVAAEEESDLIVLGVHGFGPMDRLLFGSTTQHVVRQATCPVLTTRA